MTRRSKGIWQRIYMLVIKYKCHDMKIKRHLTTFHLTSCYFKENSLLMSSLTNIVKFITGCVMWILINDSKIHYLCLPWMNIVKFIMWCIIWMLINDNIHRVFFGVVANVVIPSKHGYNNINLNLNTKFRHVNYFPITFQVWPLNLGFCLAPCCGD